MFSIQRDRVIHSLLPAARCPLPAVSSARCLLPYFKLYFFV